METPVYKECRWSTEFIGRWVAPSDKLDGNGQEESKTWNDARLPLEVIQFIRSETTFVYWCDIPA